MFDRIVESALDAQGQRLIDKIAGAEAGSPFGARPSAGVAHALAEREPKAQRVRVAGSTKGVQSKYAARWERSFACAKAFIEKHGHAGIPPAYTTEDGISLLNWVRNQQRCGRLGTLPLAREIRLKHIGLLPSAERASLTKRPKADSFAKFLQCIRDNGGSAVFDMGFKTPDGFSPYRYIANRRYQHSIGTLKPDLQANLEALGVKLTAEASLTWDEKVEKLRQCISDQSGKTVFEWKFKTDDGFRPSGFITYARDLYRRGNLSEARQASIRALGVRLVVKANDKFPVER